jgi:hypothetical protein
VNARGYKGLKKSLAAADRLFPAIAIEEPEDIIGPNSGSEIPEGMPVFLGIPVWRIDLQLVCSVSVFHCGCQSFARCKVIIIGGLKKKKIGV